MYEPCAIHSCTKKGKPLRGASSRLNSAAGPSPCTPNKVFNMPMLTNWDTGQLLDGRLGEGDAELRERGRVGLKIEGGGDVKGAGVCMVLR